MAATPATRGNGSAGIKTIQDLLVRSKDQIRMALPKHLDADRMTRIALTTIRQTPALLKCDPLSLVKCVMQAAALGLEPDSLLGRAYLVPYGTECTLIIGYRGFIDLARRSGEIQSIEAHCVYAGDEWDYSYGLNPVLYHKPTISQDRGKLVAAWGLARFKDGGYQFEVMSAADIDRVRKGSKAGNNGPWVTHYDEMARKTVLRRLAKLLPLSPALSQHVAREDAAEAGIETTASDYYGEEADPLTPIEAPTTEADKVLAKMGPVQGSANPLPAAPPADLGWVHGSEPREPGAD